MKKLKFPILLLALIAILNGSCTKNVVELPPPDFATLITQGTFKGRKINESDLLLSRDIEITAKAGASKNEVIFQETDPVQKITIEYRVNFGVNGRNGTEIIINQQLIRVPASASTASTIKTFVGVPLENGKPEQGFYQTEDANRNPINEIYFRMSVDKINWKYSVKK
ncbi:MAG: hypothetical protein EAZ97_02110 [Bacteroidetes bacterium]|nr:MAG: hypothetical protein EAZ97_02110 [Bacteroidota bacterium]